MYDVFTQFCWGVQIRGRKSRSASGFGAGVQFEGGKSAVIPVGVSSWEDQIDSIYYEEEACKHQITSSQEVRGMFPE